MTRTPNGKAPLTGGPGLPEGAGPIDTGTPVRSPGTPVREQGAPATAPRTVTGKEPADRGGADPRVTPGPTASTASAASTAVTASTDGSAGYPGSGVEDGPHPGSPLFAPAEQEAFTARIQQAVTGFVEDPHRAVREADATFDEVVASLGAVLEERGRRLRAGNGGSDAVTGAETEELRIALQHYRDLTERLVRL